MSSKGSTRIIAAGAVGAALAAYMYWANNTEDKGTLYDELGGEPAVDAAVDIFYKRVLADPTVNRFFENTNMAVQKKKQKAFMSHAFGAPIPYGGLAMNVAHRKLVKHHGMNDSHFDAIAAHLLATLMELKVQQYLIDDVMSAVGGLREQVMCRGKWAQ